MGAAIIVHGGAKTVKPEKAEANRAGCLAAVEAGWTVLRSGGSARDAVVAAICRLETDPVFNASLGATLDQDGEVSLDAGMMEGNTLRWGAVAAVQSVRHPIFAANRLLDEKHLLLVGPKADAYARDSGCEMCEPPELISAEQQHEWESGAEVIDRPATVGCVALDSNGILVAGTSTGGLTGQKPGRVGDSAIVGSGLYANRFGGCSTTGDGESIMTVVLAKTAIDFLGQNYHPNEAAERAIASLHEQVEGEAGCILIDTQGRMGWAYNSDHMPVAYMNLDLAEPIVCIERPALV
ncbi:isoaspartyl peptidase/L-asparaginase family protein [Pseudanabaena sp. FACHB-2040]|uniref:isoaspartyl peptidase/L-asparaginase family protein n=1 Tax=Pseudanabaena sp. FACHB-2040 TaxID=2692859 RepID=UPI00168894D6|nr:isoaspartyl peptidase/L-asparaginase family protein [Pseudanabaena sp. FACHB-2040]MBD2257398.1 isoaspartyl peptidase/L-asparaginase [Pseudanabaena sp. FACHB-2040]